MADEFFLFVPAVAYDVYTQFVEKFGDFRISFGIQTARMVEHFGFRRRDFRRDGTGGNDTRHLTMDDVGFFLFQHFHVGEHAFDVAQDAALIKINRTPLDAQGLGFFDERAIGRGKDDLVAALPEQPSQAEGRIFSAAEAGHGSSQNNFFHIVFSIKGCIGTRYTPYRAAAGRCTGKSKSRAARGRAYAKWWTE